MSNATIRPAYSMWPEYNRRLRDVVAALTDEQLAIRPSRERWPIWATVGHTACQRVFWLCDFAGEPGAETTRFTDAAHNCPGDDDLEHVLSADELVEALDWSHTRAGGCSCRGFRLASGRLATPVHDGPETRLRSLGCDCSDTEEPG